MSEVEKEKKVSRRRFIGYIAAAVVAAGAVGAGLTYYFTRPTAPTTATAPPAGYVKKWPTPKLDLKKDVPYVCAAFIGLANPWDELNRLGTEWYCKDVLGWDLEIVWPEADVKKENDGVEMAIAKGVDGIVACPLDSLANSKIGEMAMNADLPLVEFGIDMYHHWPLAMYQRDD
ncbi:MAG: twin-arginine translocation signal domain-containing protein, partial [Candidatus Nezhaarchaeales archaeon]